MEKTYGVFLGNHQVGKVQVLKIGLYYRFICHCKLTGSILCRLYVACGDQKESLGIVVPIGDGFGLDTRLPIKRLGEGEMTFCLLPKHSVSGRFVPIYPEEPFAYMEQLKNGFLSVQNGQVGMMISK